MLSFSDHSAFKFGNVVRLFAEHSRTAFSSRLRGSAWDCNLLVAAPLYAQNI